MPFSVKLSDLLGIWLKINKLTFLWGLYNFLLFLFIVGSTGCGCSKREKRDGAKTFHHSTKGIRGEN